MQYKSKTLFIDVLKMNNMTAIRVLYILLLTCYELGVFSFVVVPPIIISSKKGCFPRLVDIAAKDNKKATDENVKTTKNPLVEIPWYAVEAFGKIFKTNSNIGSSSNLATNNILSIDFNNPPFTVKETLQRIQLDNEREYFLSGQVDKYIYDVLCEFSDPFVSFKGRDRFIENLTNLGTFITKYSAKEILYTVDSNSVITKFMVKLELNLPWRPVLAWPWGVRCVVDPESKLIILHEESVSLFL